MREVSQKETPANLEKSFSKSCFNSEEFNSGIVTTNWVSSEGDFFWTANAANNIDKIRSGNNCFTNLLAFYRLVNFKTRCYFIARVT